MSRLVAFPLKDGGTVVVEVDEATGGPVPAARSGEVVLLCHKAPSIFRGMTDGSLDGNDAAERRFSEYLEAIGHL